MTKQNQIRVLIVDDHPIVHVGMAAALSLFPDIRIVGHAKDGEQAHTLCATSQPDVVLMDLRMSHVNGVEATRRIRNQFPKIQVIVFTSFPEESLVLEAFQAGAISYLLKDTPAQELVAAVHSAAAGERTLSPDILAALVHTVTHQSRVSAYELSERELEVLIYMGEGLTNPEIASKLVVSVNTIRHHVRSVLMKLEVTNRTAAVRLAIDNQLIPAKSDFMMARHPAP